MLPQRTPLAPRDINTIVRKELSEFKRGRIIRMHNSGATKVTIQRFYSYPYSTISNTILTNELRYDSYSLPRSSAPKCYLDAKERLILRYVRTNPKDTYQEVIDRCKVGISRKTVRRILKAYGIQN